MKYTYADCEYRRTRTLAINVSIPNPMVARPGADSIYECLTRIGSHKPPIVCRGRWFRLITGHDEMAGGGLHRFAAIGAIPCYSYSSSILACTTSTEHHTPRRAETQVDCFVQCEVVVSPISLYGIQPRDTGTPWWSLPVLWWGSH